MEPILSRNRPSDKAGTVHDTLGQVLDTALEGAFESALPTAPGEPTSVSPRWQRLNLGIAGLLVGGLAAALVTAAVVTRPNAPRQVQQFEVFPPEGATLSPGEVPALSPDGRRLAFVATAPSGSTLLWVRPLGSREVRSLADTEGATFPFWSPDGRSLAFFAHGQLKKIAVNGGPADRLATATPYPRGGAWSSHGVLLFSPGLDTPLYQVSEEGGPSTSVTTIDISRSEVSHRLPTFLPDGRRFLFVIQSGDREVTGLHWGSLDSPNVERVGDIQSKAYYADSGHLVYAREQTLVARGFEPDRLELIGEPHVLANDVAGRVGIYAERAFSVSTNGILAHWSGGAAQTEMAWFDRSGVRLESVSGPGLYDSVSLSPDGTRLAYERWDVGGFLGLWVYDIVRGVSSPFSQRSDCCPVWSPDGQRIAYGSLRGGASDIYWRSTLGAEDEEMLLDVEAFVAPSDWSPDGRFIVYLDGSASDVGLLPVGDGEERRPRWILESAAAEKDARLSPDDLWLAYTSNESSTWEVWLRSFPEPETKIQVSRRGGPIPNGGATGRSCSILDWTAV